MQNTKSTTLKILITAILLSYCGISVFSHTQWADNLPVFLSAITFIQMLVFAAFFIAYKNQHLFTTKTIIFISIVIHIIGVAGQPLFEDDYFRYLWDGYMLYSSGSPYGIPPEAFFTNENIPETFQNILSYINHPDLPTIYGPTLQYSFLLAYLIDPANIYVLKLMYALANLVIIIICLQFAKPHYVFLYACSPLVFKEILLTAHPDGLAVALLMAALWARQKQAYYAVGAFLGLSIGAKIFAILFIPFLILQQPAKVIASLLGILILLYIPILNNGASDLLGLAHMAKDWEFNSAVWGLLRVYLNIETTRYICFALLFIILGSYGYQFLLQQRKDFLLIPRGDIIFGCFLLFAPVINPWYAIWFLPFAVIRPTITAWFASFILLLAYVTPIYWPTLQLAGAYNHPNYIRWFEFGTLLVVFIFECYWYQKNNKTSLY